MANQILRLTKFTGKEAAGMAQQQIKHDLRMYDVTNADCQKARENEVLILNENLIHINDGTPVKYYDFGSKTPRELKEETAVKFSDAFKAHIKEQCGEKYKVRSNAIKAIEVLMTISPDVDKNFDWDGWARDSMKWAEKEFGKENITLAVLHKDEHTPHIHLQFIPVRDGRLNGTFYCGRASALRHLQKSYAEVTKEYGLKHRKFNTHARHEDIKHFYARMNEAIDTKIPERELLESNKHYQERLNEWAKEFKMTVFAKSEKMMREAKETTRDVREYKNEIDNMEVRIRRRSIETNIHEKQYKAMEALQYMVKKGFFDFEEIERMREAMRHGRKELDKMTEQEKREFWERSMVIPENEYHEPPIDIAEINENREPLKAEQELDDDIEFER